jgi:hypothetical protein
MAPHRFSYLLPSTAPRRFPQCSANVKLVVNVSSENPESKKKRDEFENRYFLSFSRFLLTFKLSRIARSASALCLLLRNSFVLALMIFFEDFSDIFTLTIKNVEARSEKVRLKCSSGVGSDLGLNCGFRYLTRIKNSKGMSLD